MAPEVERCLEPLGGAAFSRDVSVKPNGRLCEVTFSDTCRVWRQPADVDRAVCENIELHEGPGNEAIGLELAISCSRRFLVIPLEPRRSSIRVWGYTDKKLPRIVNETTPLLRNPSTLPNCTAAQYYEMPGSGDDDTPEGGVSWVARRVTFFPESLEDSPGTGAWDLQLRELAWDRRGGGAREIHVFLDQVFPLEFEQAMASSDPSATDWVRYNVPGVQRLTYEKAGGER